MKKNVQIIINADDYGCDKHRCEVILDAMEKGLITDTTLIANGQAFEYATKIVQKNDCMKNRVGIHFNLTCGYPLTNPIKKCNKLVQRGVFTKYLINPRNYIFPLSKQEKDAINIELLAQAEKIISAGINITHADSHQHVHNNFQVMPIVKKVCKEKGINKIRLFKNVVDKGIIKNNLINTYNCFLAKEGVYTTDYFGNLCDFLGVSDGITEIMVHLDYSQTGEIVNSVTSFGLLLNQQNLKECLQELQINDEELISYHDLK